MTGFGRTARLAGGARARRLAVPRRWPVRGIDVGWVLLGVWVLIVAMWMRHGGTETLDSPGAVLTAAGQLTGLGAAYLCLVQLVLMGRSPWLDQVFGMDRLAWAHRWLGFAAVWALLAHAVLTVWGYALGEGASLPAEAWTIAATYEGVSLSIVGSLAFVAIGISSVRAMRARLSYEAWFALHLAAYAAIALGFLHQVAVGSDFIDDPLARAFWLALYVLTGILVLVFRFGQPVALNLRHRLRVAKVVREGSGLISIYISGRDLDRLPVLAGQWFVWRFLAGPRWWSGHPFSLSAAPNGQWLRITVKAQGDDTRALQRLSPGTRVWAEGPYGILTETARTRRRVALIAGGIGIAPLRALVEGLPAAPGDLTLLYRARSPRHLVFRAELDALAAERGIRVEYLVGRRGSAEMPEDPLAAPTLRAIVPDLADRDVYLCGPVGLLDRLERTLRDLGVPGRQVHIERFAY